MKNQPEEPFAIPEPLVRAEGASLRAPSMEHGTLVPLQPIERRPLSIMKFGGTSVGDAECIRRVVQIIQDGSAASDVVVVVSAMSGVTNKLIEAANLAAAGDPDGATTLLQVLRRQHEVAVEVLIPNPVARDYVAQTMSELFDECQRGCESTALLGKLMPRMQDFISSMGERLAAPLVAAALAAHGVESEAIVATELVVTDSYHGAAEPNMEVTRKRCRARLRPLLAKNVIPIVTGFIGATEGGVLTTLGRGGSDYSATILAAALNADEVTIWTDVDGMFTADPHLVPGATTIPEISYREAAELAYFGARVLHPKTLRPVMQCGIPVWIRNSFAPERAGTKITPDGHAIDCGVKALTAVNDAALITFVRPGADSIPEVISRTVATTAAVRAEALLISCSPSRDRICVVVAAAFAQRTAAALRREFAPNLGHAENVTVDFTVAVLTVVGQNLFELTAIVGRALENLSRKNVTIIATGQGASECNVSFVVPRKDITLALLTTHREIQPVVSRPAAAQRVAAQI